MENTIIELIKQKNLTKHEKLSAILKIIIETCGINSNSYFILGSYALREHREISDLDINMDSNEFAKLQLHAPYGKIEPYNNQIRWFYDLTSVYNELADPNAKDFSIEIFKKLPTEGFPNDKFSLQYLRDTNGLVSDKNGHQFFNLETLLSWKTTMNRPKDIPDITLIETLVN
jgi:hypothetical protein